MRKNIVLNRFKIGFQLALLILHLQAGLIYAQQNSKSERNAEIVEYTSATAGAAYIQGKITEDRWLEAESATFQVEEAFLSTEYATMAQELRQEFVRENKGETLADVHDIADAIKRCGRIS